MGVPVIEDKDLKIGKVIVDELEKAPSILSVSTDFADNAPLWYYVVAEAQHEWFKRATKKGGKGDLEPMHLGSVGRKACCRDAHRPSLRRRSFVLSAGPKLGTFHRREGPDDG
jgi:hypothetical protein